MLPIPPRPCGATIDRQSRPLKGSRILGRLLRAELDLRISRLSYTLTSLLHIAETDFLAVIYILCVGEYRVGREVVAIEGAKDERAGLVAY